MYITITFSTLFHSLLFLIHLRTLTAFIRTISAVWRCGDLARLRLGSNAAPPAVASAVMMAMNSCLQVRSFVRSFVLIFIPDFFTIIEFAAILMNLLCTDSSSLSCSSFSQTNIPCTPKACLELLDRHRIPIAQRTVVVLGRSNIVGKKLLI